MLKIRYNKVSRILSGWEDGRSLFESLQPGRGEGTALLDITKPDADDYEYFLYADGILKPSGKISPVSPEPVRDALAEIDEIKDKIADYDELKTRVKELEGSK